MIIAEYKGFNYKETHYGNGAWATHAERVFDNGEVWICGLTPYGEYDGDWEIQ